MKWVIIDLSYLAHRARYGTKDLEYEDVPTGVLFGFFEQLRTICAHHHIRSNRVLICADSKKSIRKKTFPGYKSKRYDAMTEEEQKILSAMRDQVLLLRKVILPEIGIPIYRQTGLESDDLMAALAQQLDKKKEQGVLVTGDGDLFQCITEYVHWFDPMRNRYLIPAWFERQKKIAPSRWGEVKCIGGCTSDSVPGVTNVKEKTAIAYLNGTLPAHYARYKSIESKAGQDAIARNRSLVILPHEKTKPVKLKEPEMNIDAFWSMCERYGLQSYLQKTKKKEWEDFFKGKFEGAGDGKRQGKRV